LSDYQCAHLLSYNGILNISIWQHQTISAILQDIEEKQENLLKLEIRNSEDEGKYVLVISTFRIAKSGESVCAHARAWCGVCVLRQA
jgi:nitrate reductase NapAB chaperone NapD